MNASKSRCHWCLSDPLYVQYHDKEWGVPLHDDTKLFEFLILEGAQAGLNWLTILKRREHYREALENFNAEKLARYTEKRVLRLLENPKLIRNRLKLLSVVQNAKHFLQIQDNFGSFDAYIWRFVDGKPRQNKWISHQKIPVTTFESDAMAKDLKKRGFRFVGSTICYAYMQAVGMVNDHLVSCFRHSLI